MEITDGTKRGQSTSRRLTGIGTVVLHWIGTAAAVGTAYMTYAEADILFLAAMGISLFAVLLFVRSLGVTVEWLR